MKRQTMSGLYQRSNHQRLKRKISIRDVKVKGTKWKKTLRYNEAHKLFYLYILRKIIWISADTLLYICKMQIKISQRALRKWNVRRWATMSTLEPPAIETQDFQALLFVHFTKNHSLHCFTTKITTAELGQFAKMVKLLHVIGAYLNEMTIVLLCQTGN